MQGSQYYDITAKSMFLQWVKAKRLMKVSTFFHKI